MTYTSQWRRYSVCLTPQSRSMNVCCGYRSLYMRTSRCLETFKLYKSCPMNTVYVYVSVCMSVCLSVRPSVCLSVCSCLILPAFEEFKQSAVILCHTETQLIVLMIHTGRERADRREAVCCGSTKERSGNWPVCHPRRRNHTVCCHEIVWSPRTQAATVSATGIFICTLCDVLSS